MGIVNFYIELEEKIKKHPKIQEITIKKLWGEPGPDLKIILKPNAKLSYQELEDIIVPHIKKKKAQNINSDRIK